jgi:hypothetical protein
MTIINDGDFLYAMHYWTSEHYITLFRNIIENSQRCLYGEKEMIEEKAFIFCWILLIFHCKNFMVKYYINFSFPNILCNKIDIYGFLFAI